MTKCEVCKIKNSPLNTINTHVWSEPCFKTIDAWTEQIADIIVKVYKKECDRCGNIILETEIVQLNKQQLIN